MYIIGVQVNSSSPGMHQVCQAHGCVLAVIQQATERNSSPLVNRIMPIILVMVECFGVCLFIVFGYEGREMVDEALWWVGCVICVLFEKRKRKK